MLRPIANFDQPEAQFASQVNFSPAMKTAHMSTVEIAALGFAGYILLKQALFLTSQESQSNAITIAETNISPAHLKLTTHAHKSSS